MSKKPDRFDNFAFGVMLFLAALLVLIVCGAGFLGFLDLFK